MACPTPIGFFYLGASSEGLCGAINYRSDGKLYDSITTSHKVNSTCKTPASKEPSNYLNCPAKSSAYDANSTTAGSITSNFTYKVDQYGNIETKRSDTGSRDDNNNGSGGGMGGSGGKLGSPLFCYNAADKSKVKGTVKLKGEYKNVGACGGKEYNIKSTGQSSGESTYTGTSTQNTCGSQSPIFGGPRDCSMVGQVVPINDFTSLGGPCSSINGYPDRENVPGCNSIIAGYHSGYTIIEDIASTIGTWLEYIGNFLGAGDGCMNKGNYSQTVSDVCTKEKRRGLADQVVNTRLSIVDSNSPQQKCEPNKCLDSIFKKDLACYGWTLSNPHNFGINDTLSSGVGGLIFRAGAYTGGELNLFPENQKVKMFFYYIPCDRDEYGHLQSRETLQLCDCGKTTPITSTSPGKELSITINSKENLTTTYQEDGKTIASQAIISSKSNKWKNTDSPADTSTQICWVYDE